MNKNELPEKICIICKRPFKWRKKWILNWMEVKYWTKKCTRKSKQFNELEYRI